jgi:hypothetical protein
MHGELYQVMKENDEDEILLDKLQERSKGAEIFSAATCTRPTTCPSYVGTFRTHDTVTTERPRHRSTRDSFRSRPFSGFSAFGFADIYALGHRVEGQVEIVVIARRCMVCIALTCPPPPHDAMTTKQEHTAPEGKKRRHNVGKACENCRRR